ncbi:abhydrolase domain-containing protein C22H12.03 [Aspergillus awamori]|uniref:Abhydrolase domain-containing protein C22H12.03 n=1 Tax=Aspergillus awamori TaxID=105351 RepID=A0A401KDZ9_ASPAW|nr:abhydrolase domain-containing protein C22H12.03 [Aspergillus awamori]
MRNHGESGHHPKHDYMEMALDVKSFIERHQLRAPTIIGHSMGAKTALTLALESPTLIKDVVAIDNCPIRLPLESDFVRYLEGLARLRDERITDHLQADKILTQYEKSPAIRAWLISNLHKKPDTHFLQLRVPVETLSTAIRPLGEFPYRVGEESQAIRQFNGRVLFLRALQSNFIPESALPLINSFFPSSEIVDIDCGHWIVQEKTEEFRKSELPTAPPALYIIALEHVLGVFQSPAQAPPLLYSKARVHRNTKMWFKAQRSWHDAGSDQGSGPSIHSLIYRNSVILLLAMISSTSAPIPRTLSNTFRICFWIKNVSLESDLIINEVLLLHGFRYPIDNDKNYAPDEKVEEEELPDYEARRFYPVRLGEIFQNRYQVGAKLGFGSSSTTWLSRDLTNGHYVALKVYVHTSSFHREVPFYNHVKQQLQTSSHQGRYNIRKLLDSFTVSSQDGTHTVLIFEAAQMSLRDMKVVFQQGGFDEDLVKGAITELLQAVDFLHTQGQSVHTDIHPGNLLLGAYDNQSLSALEHRELVSPVPRKPVSPTRTIYLSRLMRPQVGPMLLSDFGETRIGPGPHGGDIMPLEYRAPEILLHIGSRLSDKSGFLRFMRKTLTWLPEERATAKELLQDPWLRG